MCTMARDQSCTHLESLMRECGSTEDQQVCHSCITNGTFSKVLSFARVYIGILNVYIIHCRSVIVMSMPHTLYNCMRV